MMSLAQVRIGHDKLWNKSLTYKIKSNGPKLEPCETKESRRLEITIMYIVRSISIIQKLFY